MVQRAELVRYLSDILRISEFKDFTYNGLQVEGGTEINKVGLAVDASLATFEALADCQLICVHHGLMWPSWDRLQGVNRRRLAFLIERNINLFVSHLPLDAHPQLGHNAQILSQLGWEKTDSFGEVGWLCDLEEAIDPQAAQKEIQRLFPQPLASFWHGPQRIKRIGVCSGGGGHAYLEQAIKDHLDLYLTGETTYSMYHDSLEYGLNIVCLGHYATETWGLKALQKEIGTRCGVETVVASVPTGL